MVTVTEGEGMVVLRAKSERVTGRYVMSINPKVEVLMPGCWAEGPLKDELHTPEVAGRPVRVQSM